MDAITTDALTKQAEQLKQWLKDAIRDCDTMLQEIFRMKYVAVRTELKRRKKAARQCG